LKMIGWKEGSGLGTDSEGSIELCASSGTVKTERNP
jgi:hypothetical protein